MLWIAHGIRPPQLTSHRNPENGVIPGRKGRAARGRGSRAEYGVNAPTKAATQPSPEMRAQPVTSVHYDAADHPGVQRAHVRIDSAVRESSRCGPVGEYWYILRRSEPAERHVVRQSRERPGHASAGGDVHVGRGERQARRGHGDRRRGLLHGDRCQGGTSDTTRAERDGELRSARACAPTDSPPPQAVITDATSAAVVLRMRLLYSIGEPTLSPLRNEDVEAHAVAV
jgi:hypothetical protein